MIRYVYILLDDHHNQFTPIATYRYKNFLFSDEIFQDPLSKKFLSEMRCNVINHHSAAGARRQDWAVSHPLLPASTWAFSPSPDVSPAFRFCPGGICSTRSYRSGVPLFHHPEPESPTVSLSPFLSFWLLWVFVAPQGLSLCG